MWTVVFISLVSMMHLYSFFFSVCDCVSVCSCAHTCVCDHCRNSSKPLCSWWRWCSSVWRGDGLIRCQHTVHVLTSPARGGRGNSHAQDPRALISATNIHPHGYTYSISRPVSMYFSTMLARLSRITQDVNPCEGVRRVKDSSFFQTWCVTRHHVQVSVTSRARGMWNTAQQVVS